MEPYKSFDGGAQTALMVLISCALAAYLVAWLRTRKSRVKRSYGTNGENWLNEARYIGTVRTGGMERAFNIGATSPEDACRQLRSFYHTGCEILSVTRSEEGIIDGRTNSKEEWEEREL